MGQAEHDAINYKANGHDRTGLKAASRRVIPMKLNVKGVQKDRSDQKLGDYPQDKMVMH
jgi:hypothetical protein